MSELIRPPDDPNSSQESPSNSSLPPQEAPNPSPAAEPRYQLRQRNQKAPPTPTGISSSPIRKPQPPAKKPRRPRAMANEAVKRFFSSPHFAVAGASQDTNKFGYKILAWYHAHSLAATPLNPRASSITLSTLASSPSVPVAASPSALPNPQETSLSLVTPPPVTLALLKEAKKAGIKAVWLQPGTFNDEVMRYVHGEAEGEDKGGFETHLAGFEVEEGQRGPGGGEGWCVLVDGPGGLRAAGREEGRM